MPKTIRIISRRNQARAGCGAIRTRGAAGVDSGEEIKQYSSKLAIFSFVVMKRPGASSWARERKASSGGVLVDSEAVCRGTWEGKAQRRWKQKPRSRRQLQNRRRKMRSPSKRTEISVLKSSKFARIGTSGEEGVFIHLLGSRGRLAGRFSQRSGRRDARDVQEATFEESNLESSRRSAAG